MAPSPGQFFTSPEGFQQPHVGQASYNEQDDFNDPSGKYKLVMKGEAYHCNTAQSSSASAEASILGTDRHC